MKEMQIFENQEFGAVRTVELDGEPWLVGKDVAQALGYSNPRKALADHVDEEDKGVTKCDTLGGVQEMTITRAACIPWCCPASCRGRRSSGGG